MGTLINIVSTKKQTTCHASQRLWIPLWKPVDLNGIGMIPMLSKTDSENEYEMLLIFFNAAGQRKTLRVKPGQWINDVQLLTGLKVLPLAIDANQGRLFLEVAATSPRVKFNKDIG